MITIENLSKKYLLQQSVQNEGLRHLLEEYLKNPLHKISSQIKTDKREVFWALKNISLNINQGEIVGIIGKNGAGKSTLLKILSRITEPSGGRVVLRGRVASLLEVGTGFHPELSGRENIFLNGAILGMTRNEIRKKFDEIVAFAEVERFLDTPVKRYSSGMYVRLAFAVAAHLEPEILVVDEVLAVGDYEFQNKCLNKMQEVGGQSGRTVLFVSHNMNAIANLTHRCILLEKGSLKKDGPTAEVISAYLEAGQEKGTKVNLPAQLKKPSILRAEVFTSEPNGVHHQGKALRFEFDIHMPEKTFGKAFSFQICDAMQRPVIHLWKYDKETPTLRKKGINTLLCEIPICRLNVGRFQIRAILAGSPPDPIDQIVEHACEFEVVIHDRQTLFGWRPEVCAYLEEAVWIEN